MDAASAVPRPLVEAAPVRFVAATDDGLALVEAASDEGRIVARVATEAKVHDLVVDRAGRRVFTFETNDEGEGGHVIERSVDALATPRIRAFVDGRARLAITTTPSASQMLVLFEQSYGARWRIASEGGPPLASLVAPMPSSAWSQGARIHAFGAEPDGRWTLRVVDATATGLVPVITHHVAGIEHETARAEGDWVLDLVGSRVVVRSPFAATTSVDADGIVDARRLRDDLVAIVTSGPARVSVLGGADASAVASLPLDAVHAEAGLPGRALVTLEEARFVVATTRSVTPVRVTVAADGLRLDPGPRIDGVHAPASGPL